MNYWIITICLVVIFTPLIALLVSSAKSRSMSPGEEGEYYVAERLKRLNREKYFVINDFLFRKRNGYTNQIDHLVVSPYGVFVIETKNIYGYIHGSEKSKLWRSYWRDGRDLAFDNPISQNEAHINALSDRLGDGRQIYYISVIAFSPNADLQVNVGEDVRVIYWTQIRELIRAYAEPVMSIEETQNLYEEILALNITDAEIRSKHGQYANARKVSFEEKTNNAIDSGKCPKCGGELVRRTGTYGDFYGCSNYPDCKYTHPAG